MTTEMKRANYDMDRWLKSALQLLDSVDGFIDAAAQTAGPVRADVLRSLDYAKIRLADARSSIEEAQTGVKVR